MYAFKTHLFKTKDDASNAFRDLSKEDTIVEVTVTQTRTTPAEAAALDELASYAFAIKKDAGHGRSGLGYIKPDGTLNEGGRLLLAALRDARAEGVSAAQENLNVDVLGGMTPEQFAVWYLMSVIDWCHDHWLKPEPGQRSNKMAKYFTLASMFRKGKWQARATWPDPPTGEQLHGEDW